MCLGAETGTVCSKFFSTGHLDRAVPQKSSHNFRFPEIKLHVISVQLH